MGSYQQWRDVLSGLNGKIYLVLGNHDSQYSMRKFRNRFERIAQQMTIHVGKQCLILNHSPLLCYGGELGDVWQLFGHVHSGPLSIDGFDLPRLKMLFPRQYDVGVDNSVLCLLQRCRLLLISRSLPLVCFDNFFYRCTYSEGTYHIWIQS